MAEEPSTHREVRPALNAVDDAPAQACEEAVYHDAKFRLNASGLRNDQRSALHAGEEASFDAVGAADRVVADDDLGSAEPQQGRAAPEEPKLDPVARLPAANEPPARARDLPPIPMAESSRTLLGEGHHRTDSAHTLLGHEGAIGVSPFH